MARLKNMENFLKRNEEFTKLNKQVEEILSQLRHIFKELSKEDISFLEKMKNKLNKFNGFHEEEISKLLLLRNKYIYKTETIHDKKLKKNISIAKDIIKELRNFSSLFEEDEKDFLNSIIDMFKKEKYISNEEELKLVSLRQKYIYAKNKKYVMDYNQEAICVILDAKDILKRHVLDAIFKLRNIFRVDQFSFSETDIKCLSFFKDVKDTEEFFNYSKIFELLTIASKKEISFDIPFTDLLELYERLEDLSIVNLKTFSLEHYNMSKYKRILELRNKNISYLN